MGELRVIETALAELEHRGNYAGLVTELKNGEVSIVRLLFNRNAGSSLSAEWDDQILTGDIQTIKDLNNATRAILDRLNE